MGSTGTNTPRNPMAKASQAQAKRMVFFTKAPIVRSCMRGGLRFVTRGRRFKPAARSIDPSRLLDPVIQTDRSKLAVRGSRATRAFAETAFVAGVHCRVNSRGRALGLRSFKGKRRAALLFRQKGFHQWALLVSDDKHALSWRFSCRILPAGLNRAVLREEGEGRGLSRTFVHGFAR